ncbi:Rha family transcriptional regulator [Ancylobacter sp. WKF20]|uniref:Rha family transcriptional regulator n=1 Tax=Ancylobacter sp. WKF20 TaxID=3039801 RepID=UPI0024346437|nr:Rha family transcriptional regulator [Ancylobacter sp. WKF20]WGD28937.1 Rha family transcriptional regulator [Ancylobacter sp. WKF20]
MAYYLNEEQALLVCLLSRTEWAKQVRADVIRVYSRDGTVFASSRDVAAFFGKQHTHVLRDIRALIADAPSTASNFGSSEYQDSTGRTLPAYEMTRDGFTLLAMGLAGKTALAFKVRYIDQFNRMEARLKAPAKPALFDWQTSSFSASHRARQRPALVRLGSWVRQQKAALATILAIMSSRLTFQFAHDTPHKWCPAISLEKSAPLRTTASRLPAPLCVSRVRPPTSRSHPCVMAPTMEEAGTR